MTKSLARNEPEVYELTVGRQEAMEASELKEVRQMVRKANYKVDVVERQIGDLQKQVTGLQERMNRMETMLRRLVNSQARATDLTTGRCASNLRPSEEPRDLPGLVPPAQLENEKTRRIDELRRINFNSTQGIHLMGVSEGNFDFPSTGFSVVATGWEQDQLPNVSLRRIECENPKDPNEVFVKYDARLEDSTVVSKSEGVEFTVKDGYFCPALALAVKTMKKAEKVLLKIKPQKGFGERGKLAAGEEGAVPPNAIFLVDLESVYALAMNDIRNLLVSGGTEQVIRVWDPGTGSKNMKWQSSLLGVGGGLTFGVVSAVGRVQPEDLEQLSTFGTASRSFRARRETVSALPVEAFRKSSKKASIKLWEKGDLPTQHILPRRRIVVFNTMGLMEVVCNRQSGITGVRMEEDAGKLLHSESGSYSQVDLNSAGVPLLEIVSEPDMRTGIETAEYGAELQRLVRYLGVSNGNMQEVPFAVM